jgi:hypothetical protein
MKFEALSIWREPGRKYKQNDLNWPLGTTQTEKGQR